MTSSQDAAIERMAKAIADGLWTRFRDILRPFLVAIALIFGLLGLVASNIQCTGLGIIVAILLVAEAIHK
jgi:hypothetical protein